MSGGDPSLPPSSNGGDLLLRLLQTPHHNHQQPQQQPPPFLPDPAIASVGPTLPSNHHHNNHHPISLSPPQGLFPPPSTQTPSFYSSDAFFRHKNHNSHSVFSGNIEEERELGFGLGSSTSNGSDPNRRMDPRLSWANGSPNQRRPAPPPGFSSKPRNQMRDFEGFDDSAFEFNNHNHNHNHRVFGYENNVNGFGRSGQLDPPGLPSGSSSHSVLGSPIEQSLRSFRGGVDDYDVGQVEIDDLSEQLVDSVLGEDQFNEKNDSGGKKKYHRDKDFRSDARGKWMLSQRMRNSRRLIECRRDIDRFDSQFLAIYESLMPAEEVISKQTKLFTLLEQLVCKEWPNAKMYLYGSCANSFGVLKSDIDVCLAIDDQDINKSEMLLKLADILRSGNLQDVQALTHARVPIVKLMDPVSGISCDICINNILAVVNTKLLRNYAEIDVRLRQLAFLVKHWAKSRRVNETYQGTLSSYAYVLMCIHFLQLRNPPILPCLQNMKSTYGVTVDNIECAFFDQVEKLRDFGSGNKENISKLLWGFFSYWAYCHDYTNQVISVRSGCILSKLEKDWTRRIGNDRHLICIEDPFETSHDLGRVVDKYSIRVLREEFERAAEIMQYDPNPCVALFQPYNPR